MSGRAEIDLLDTTLRDGNYVVNFRFTANDTAWLATRLEECGLRWIEIGHGLGLRASEVHGEAGASDADYIRAARGALATAKFGMFAIPGIARPDDIRMAADLGMDFVRIGANVDRVPEMEPLIKAARQCGLFVCTNFMKSYCLPPPAFAELGKLAEGYGSQMNYVVDSAGGMLPEDVRTYFEALRAATSVPMGFHGHDNIRLAIANSLAAIEAGAWLVDATLFGVGRGSGNAATELMVPLLNRRYGVLSEIDATRLIQLAESQAAPLLHTRHQESVSMSLGLAQVHSMYLDRIVERADREAIDPHHLIAAVGAIDRLTVTDAILDRAVEKVKSETPRLSLPVGGIFALPSNTDPQVVIPIAENLAEKIGVPCRIRLQGGLLPPVARIEIGDGVVTATVGGDPIAAAAVARRPVTTLVVELAARSDLAAIRGATPCRVSSADDA